jgi:hypothetical protein
MYLYTYTGVLEPLYILTAHVHIIIRHIYPYRLTCIISVVSHLYKTCVMSYTSCPRLSIELSTRGDYASCHIHHMSSTIEQTKLSIRGDYSMKVTAIYAHVCAPSQLVSYPSYPRPSIKLPILGDYSMQQPMCAPHRLALTFPVCVFSQRWRRHPGRNLLHPLPARRGHD